MRLKYQLNDRLAREVRVLFNYYFTSFSIISVLKTVKLCQGMTQLSRKWKIAIADGIGGAIGGLAGGGPFSAFGALRGAIAASVIADIFLD